MFFTVKIYGIPTNLYDFNPEMRQNALNGCAEKVRKAIVMSTQRQEREVIIIFPLEEVVPKGNDKIIFVEASGPWQSLHIPQVMTRVGRDIAEAVENFIRSEGLKVEKVRVSVENTDSYVHTRRIES